MSSILSTARNVMPLFVSAYSSAIISLAWDLSLFNSDGSLVLVADLYVVLFR